MKLPLLLAATLALPALAIEPEWNERGDRRNAEANGSSWSFTYTPKDPAKHIVFGVDVWDSRGYATDIYGRFTEVYSIYSTVNR